MILDLLAYQVMLLTKDGVCVNRYVTIMDWRDCPCDQLAHGFLCKGTSRIRRGTARPVQSALSVAVELAELT